MAAHLDGAEVEIGVGDVTAEMMGWAGQAGAPRVKGRMRDPGGS